jgi:hypothetical protein
MSVNSTGGIYMDPQTGCDTPSVSSRDGATLTAAQRDMRVAYLDGAPGVLVSGLVWAVAGCVAVWSTPQRAIWALFIGGALIHPLAVLLTRLLGYTGRHALGNPLGPLAMATTFWMIMMLPLAYGVSLLRIDLFFPAMLLVIGGRYLCFHTLYGKRLYWIFGATLALASYALIGLNASVALGGFAGAVIEVVFACVLLAGARREAAVQGAAARA